MDLFLRLFIQAKLIRESDHMMLLHAMDWSIFKATGTDLLTMGVILLTMVALIAYQIFFKDPKEE